MRFVGLSLCRCAASAAAVACWVAVASALPPGRAWTPAARLAIPGFEYSGGPRLELSESGKPFLINRTVTPNNLFAFDWVDSAWVQRWRAEYTTVALWPVQSPPRTHYLVWNGLGPTADERLFMAEIHDDGIGAPDTVTKVAWVRTEYSAGVSPKRKWVAVNDIVANRRKLRILYSDATAIWHEVSTERFHDLTDGVAVAATGDSIALVAWTETFRLRWGTLDGTNWVEGQPFPDIGAQRMQFRRRPSGGQWLASAGFEAHVNLRSVHGGVWSPPETLRCAYRDGLPNHYAQTPDLSRDDGEFPVIAWDAQNIRANNTICICVPTDAGYGVAEELDGVEGDLGLPSVARDRNGDVWVAWAERGRDAAWMHSYNRATTSTPRVVGAGRSRRVEWTLSESAPETWWAVLRARGAGDFEEVARVRAGPGLEMSWADTSPPTGLLRYRIRRESVDTRYLWESPAGHFPERARGPILRRPERLPLARSTALEFENAALGAYEVRLYDVQGRVAHRQRGYASGRGLDSVVFDFDRATTPLTSGVYFATVRDATGEASPAVRIVILR